jgi:hypothetical protein
MTDILQGALDPRVAPRGILRRHPDDELVDLREHAAATRPGDQLSVLAEQRVGRDDRGDLAQHSTAHPEGPHREAPPVVIRQAQAPPPELPAQEAVLFDQVGDRLPFSAFEPAGEDQQQHLEGRGIEHERGLYHSRECFAVANRSIALWDTRPRRARVTRCLAFTLPSTVIRTICDL